MRIVQVLTQTTGGPADHVADVARALAARGHDSHVVGPASDRRAELTAAGVTWHTAAMDHKLDVRGAAALVSRIRGLRPDVVHGQDRRAGWIVRGLAPVLGARCVYTLHGVPDGLSDLVEGNVRAAPRRRRDRLYYLWGERLVTRWSGGVVVVPSEAVARYAVAHVGLPRRLVHVVRNGVDPTAWVPGATGPAPADGSLVVAWVGLLGTVKRVDVLLQAVEQVPGVSVLLAGDGPLREEIEREIARRGLDGRVSMLGMVADVRPVLGAADLFVLTSAAENLPMALLQAMSSGLPSVASAVGGVPELVRHDVDGWLVPAGDVAATAAALAHAAAHRDDLAAMGARARARVVEGWTLDQCVDGLVEVYAGADSRVESRVESGAGTTGERALRQLVVIAELGSGGAESVVAQLAARARSRGEAVAVASAGGWRAQALADAGAELVPLPLGRATLRDTVTSVRDLRRRLASAPVDVVHAHNVRAALVARLAVAGRRPRPPVLVSVHGLPARRYALAARLLGAAADLVVAVSPDVADRLVAGGLPPARLRVVDNAPGDPAAVDRDTARSDLGLPPTGPVVLWLARLAPPKRPDLALRAVAATPGVRLLVAGDGALRAEVEMLVRELDLGDRVDVLGDRRDVARLLAAADLVVLASDSEGLPITVLEAMAAGVPVVASRVGGLAALDPHAVRLVAPGDADALAAAVAELLGDPALVRGQVACARELVARRFSTSAMDRGYRAVVAELLGRAAPGADV